MTPLKWEQHRCKHDPSLIHDMCSSCGRLFCCERDGDTHHTRCTKRRVHLFVDRASPRRYRSGLRS